MSDTADSAYVALKANILAAIPTDALPQLAFLSQPCVAGTAFTWLEFIAGALLGLFIPALIAVVLRPAPKTRTLPDAAPPSETTDVEVKNNGGDLGLLFSEEPGLVLVGVARSSPAERAGAARFVLGARLTHVNRGVVGSLGDIGAAVGAAPAGPEAPPLVLTFTRLGDTERAEQAARERGRLLSRIEEAKAAAVAAAASAAAENPSQTQLLQLEEDAARRDAMIQRLESELHGAAEALEREEHTNLQLQAELQAASSADTALQRALGEGTRPPPPLELAALRATVEQKDATINALTREVQAMERRGGERGAEAAAQEARADQALADALAEAAARGDEARRLREETAALREECAAALGATAGTADAQLLAEEVKDLQQLLAQREASQAAEASALRAELAAAEAARAEAAAEAEKQADEAEKVREQAAAAATAAEANTATLHTMAVQADQRAELLDRIGGERAAALREREEAAAALAEASDEVRRLQAAAARRAEELQAAQEEGAGLAREVAALEEEVQTRRRAHEAALESLETQAREAEALRARAAAAEADGGAAEKEAEARRLQAALGTVQERVSRTEEMLEEAREKERRLVAEVESLRTRLVELETSRSQSPSAASGDGGAGGEAARLTFVHEAEMGQAREALAEVQSRVRELESELARVADERVDIARENRALVERLESSGGTEATSEELEHLRQQLKVEQQNSIELLDRVAAGEHKNNVLQTSNSTLEDMLSASKQRVDSLETTCCSREEAVKALEEEVRVLRAGMTPARVPERTGSVTSVPSHTADNTAPRGAYYSPEADQYGSLEVVSERGNSKSPLGTRAQSYHAGSPQARTPGSQLPTAPSQVELLRMKNGLSFGPPTGASHTTSPAPANRSSAPPAAAASTPNRAGSTAATFAYERRAAGGTSASASATDAGSYAAPTPEALAAALAPQTPTIIVVNSVEKPVVKGTYELMDGVTHNGYPMWAAGTHRIFSSREGYWMVSADEAGPVKNVGRLVSSTTHEGRQPDDIVSWDYSNGTEWLTSQKTRLVRVARRDSGADLRGVSDSPVRPAAHPKQSPNVRLSIPSKDALRGAEHGLPQGWEVSETGVAVRPEGGVYGSVTDAQAAVSKTPASLQVCTAFSAGLCRKGSACPNLHDAPVKRAYSNSSLVSPSF
eukprot:Rhum_TRINITY_DN15264_c13_g1::Rhum_TRINITY_DN15264_c13_g1_i1::g.149271::m.149271